ncbi:MULTISPECIES: hypothetical protein [unclassified Xanthobacter]|uniref:hypothetical protein n=1 Tax=unclassified Xanthobacter TaxID=2623496 RepID=UPI001F46F1A4|nr:MULTISPECIES: hypothetical protein [unclassified Xanthobacter]
MARKTKGVAARGGADSSDAERIYGFSFDTNIPEHRQLHGFLTTRISGSRRRHYMMDLMLIGFHVVRGQHGGRVPLTMPSTLLAELSEDDAAQARAAAAPPPFIPPPLAPASPSKRIPVTRAASPEPEALTRGASGGELRAPPAGSPVREEAPAPAASSAPAVAEVGLLAALRGFEG